MQNIELRYDPITSEGDLTEEEFTRYLEQRGLGTLVDKLVIDPVEEALKSLKRNLIVLGNISLSRTEKRGTSTSWKPALDELATFLDIRADDARAMAMKDVTYAEGVGYCINVAEWGEQIKKQIQSNTAQTMSIGIGWPKARKEDYPVRRLEMPVRDFRKVDEETVKIAIQVRKFKASLDKEVVTPFKDKVKEWHARQTGYDSEKIPSAEDSPVPRARKIGEGKYVLIQLVRVEDYDYQNVVQTLKAEQSRLAEGETFSWYRTTSVRNDIFVNIKTVRDRLQAIKENSKKIKARYEIVP